MPTIRLPKSTEPLLPYCRRCEDAVENPCFDTYADLVVFAAAYGYKSFNGRKPGDPEAFLTSPYPIDLAVFKNQQLFPPLLLMALATDGNQGIARDEEALCRMTEGFADRGLKILLKEISVPSLAHLNLAAIIERAFSEFEEVGI